MTPGGAWWCRVAPAGQNSKTLEDRADPMEAELKNAPNQKLSLDDPLYLHIAPGFKDPSHSSADSGWKRGPLYKNPPTQLNFFELLRASLGDSQFNDVWLVPEAQGSGLPCGYRKWLQNLRGLLRPHSQSVEL